MLLLDKSLGTWL